MVRKISKVAVWFVIHAWDTITRQSKMWHKWTLENPAVTAAWAFLCQDTNFKCFCEGWYFHSPESSIKRTRRLKKKVLWHFCKISLHRQASDWLLAAPLSEGPQPSDKAVTYAVTFPMLHVRHYGLSALIALHSKYRNKLDVQSYQKLKLASFQTFSLWELQLAHVISLMT